MAVLITIKKWGNSLGAVLPSELVEEQHLKENQKVLIEVVNKADLTEMFGSLKSKVPAQKFKDMVRAGWESSSDREFRLKFAGKK